MSKKNNFIFMFKNILHSKKVSTRGSSLMGMVFMMATTISFILLGFSMIVVIEKRRNMSNAGSQAAFYGAESVIYDALYHYKKDPDWSPSPTEIITVGGNPVTRTITTSGADTTITAETDVLVRKLQVVKSGDLVASRKPVDIVLTVDLTGSLVTPTSTNLTRLKQALSNFVKGEQLTANDRIALVWYNSMIYPPGSNVLPIINPQCTYAGGQPSFHNADDTQQQWLADQIALFNNGSVVNNAYTARGNTMTNFAIDTAKALIDQTLTDPARTPDLVDKYIIVFSDGMPNSYCDAGTPLVPGGTDLMPKICPGAGCVRPTNGCEWQCMDPEGDSLYLPIKAGKRYGNQCTERTINAATNAKSVAKVYSIYLERNTGCADLCDLSDATTPCYSTSDPIYIAANTSMKELARLTMQAVASVPDGENKTFYNVTDSNQLNSIYQGILTTETVSKTKFVEVEP